MKAVLKAFSLEQAPHINVITSVIPFGATYKEGVRDGIEAVGEGGGEGRCTDMIVINQFHNVYILKNSYRKKCIVYCFKCI